MHLGLVSRRIETTRIENISWIEVDERLRLCTRRQILYYIKCLCPCRFSVQLMREKNTALSPMNVCGRVWYCAIWAHKIIHTVLIGFCRALCLLIGLLMEQLNSRFCLPFHLSPGWSLPPWHAFSHAYLARTTWSCFHAWSALHPRLSLYCLRRQCTTFVWHRRHEVLPIIGEVVRGDTL